MTGEGGADESLDCAPFDSLPSTSLPSTRSTRSGSPHCSDRVSALLRRVLRVAPTSHQLPGLPSTTAGSPPPFDKLRIYDNAAQLPRAAGAG